MAKSGLSASASSSQIRLLSKTEPIPAIGWQRFCSEPFRPFFLLGWIVSLIAIGVWPLFFAGVTTRYPSFAHAYLIVQFFFGAFTVGFLWTALPRMLEVPGPGPSFVCGGAGLIVAGSGLHLLGFHPAGHLAFLALFGLVLTFGIRRFPARRDLPPPSFLLVASGIVLGSIGTALVAAGECGWIGGFTYRFGRVLLTEYCLLFLVVGVAAFLAPRFLGQKPRQGFASSRNPTKTWAKQAKISGVVALTLICGAAFHAAGLVRTGALITALPVTFFVLYHVRIWRGQEYMTWISVGMRLALLFAIAAPWTRFFWPDMRILSSHLLLLGGFGLITLMVGARVTFGHSGYERLFRSRMHTLGAVVGLYFFSLVTRLAGEVFPSHWTHFLVCSAFLLVGAHLLWGVLIIPKILWPLPEEDEQIPHTIRQTTQRLISGSMANLDHVSKATQMGIRHSRHSRSS